VTSDRDPASADAATGEGGTDDGRARSLLLVSRAIVKLYEEQFGRGPKSAHSSPMAGTKAVSTPDLRRHSPSIPACQDSVQVL